MTPMIPIATPTPIPAPEAGVMLQDDDFSLIVGVLVPPVGVEVPVCDAVAVDAVVVVVAEPVIEAVLEESVAEFVLTATFWACQYRSPFTQMMQNVRTPE